MRTVFVDVDTQIDFLFPAGALYVPGAELLLPNIARLNQWAVAHNAPLLSTADAHAENDPEFLRWPPHCIAGTLGQHKPQATLTDDRSVLSSIPGASAAAAAQVIVEKQHNDLFTNPNLVPLLDKLAADRYVVYGVVTEICVRCAAIGLLQRGGRVELVTDAIQTLDEVESSRMMDEFTAGGGVLTTTAAVTG